MSTLTTLPNGCKTEIFTNNTNNNFKHYNFGNKNETQDVYSHNGQICQSKNDEILFSGNNLQVSFIQNFFLFILHISNHFSQKKKVNRYYYTDSKGALCSWEGVEKLNDNSSTGHTDTTMCTIAVLKRQIRCDCLLLVRQYRATTSTLYN